MPVPTRFVLVASMDIDPAYEDLFNEVYDAEHVPYLLSVPGVRRVIRLRARPAGIAIAGGSQPLPEAHPRNMAIYEIDDPSVLASPEWAAAVEAGRWAGEVRPDTSNRRHAVDQSTFDMSEEL